MHSLRYASNLTSALRVQRAFPQRALPSSLLTLRRTVVSECFCPTRIKRVWFHTPVFPAKRYTKDHEVIKYDDKSGVGTVSITDYAQKSLGDVVFVELPETGATIQQGGKSAPKFQVVPGGVSQENSPRFHYWKLAVLYCTERTLAYYFASRQIPLAPWKASKRPRTLCVPTRQHPRR